MTELPDKITKEVAMKSHRHHWKSIGHIVIFVNRIVSQENVESEMQILHQCTICKIIKLFYEERDSDEDDYE